MKLLEKLQTMKVVPVIAMESASNAAKLAKVLVDNGLPCAEVTFRTPAAKEAIINMRKAYPDMLLGAGTVLTTKHVDDAIEAGVDFIVSPGFNPSIVKYSHQRKVKIIPGVNNPSLVEQALGMGVDTLKFFPAEPSGGVAMLKSLSAVYPVNFMPTGGVNEANINNYLTLPSVLACGGTWMVPHTLIENEQWEDIAVLVRTVVEQLRKLVV